MPPSVGHTKTAKVVQRTRLAFEEAGLMLLRVLRIPTRNSCEAQLNQFHEDFEVPATQAIELHEKWLDVLDDYVACVTHEMNRPLGSILGKAEMGMTLIDSQKTNAMELRWIAAEIRSEADRAAILMDAIHHVLRKEAAAINAANCGAKSKDLLGSRQLT